jgi:hypothetical protein
MSLDGRLPKKPDEHASLELFDLIEEVDEEIRELQTQIRKIA